jgi:hypothetical protein
MDGIIEFLMEKIIIPIFVFGLAIIMILGIIAIPLCIKQEAQEKQRIESCFMQEPRTKECEFALWQHELEMIKSESRTTVMPMPVVVK